MLVSNYSRKVNPIIEGVSVSNSYDAINYIIEKGFMKGLGHKWVDMKDSAAGRTILHLAAESNNGFIADKIIKSCLKDGEDSNQIVKKLLSCRENEEGLTPKLYADPH